MPFDDKRGRMSLEPEDYGVLTGMLIDNLDLSLALTLEEATVHRTEGDRGDICCSAGERFVFADGRAPQRNTERLWRSEKV